MNQSSSDRSDRVNVSQARARISLSRLLRLVHHSRMSKRASIREGHDRAARRLFSHPRVIADLLLGFMPRELLGKIDPGSLRRLSDERVNGRLNRLQGDLTWQIELADGASVVVMLEVQSTPDRTMAARMTAHLGMFYENLLRTAPKMELPAVLPVVFYTGQRPWRATRDLAEFVSVNASLLAYLSRPCYLLVAAGVLASSQLPDRNRVSLKIRIETATEAAELYEALNTAGDWLAADDEGLWRDYVTWVQEVQMPIKFPEMDMDKITTPREAFTMIAETLKKEMRRERAQGMAQGREQGMEKGMEQGLARQRYLLGRQAEHRFGTSTAEKLRGRLDSMRDDDEFERVSDWIVDCQTGAELLEKVRERVAQ